MKFRYLGVFILFFMLLPIAHAQSASDGAVSQALAPVKTMMTEKYHIQPSLDSTVSVITQLLYSFPGGFPGGLPGSTGSFVVIVTTTGAQETFGSKTSGPNGKSVNVKDFSAREEETSPNNLSLEILINKDILIFIKGPAALVREAAEKINYQAFVDLAK